MSATDQNMRKSHKRSKLYLKNPFARRDRKCSSELQNFALTEGLTTRSGNDPTPGINSEELLRAPDPITAPNPNHGSSSAEPPDTLPPLLVTADSSTDITVPRVNAVSQPLSENLCNVSEVHINQLSSNSSSSQALPSQQNNDESTTEVRIASAVVPNDSADADHSTDVELEWNPWKLAAENLESSKDGRKLMQTFNRSLDNELEGLFGVETSLQNHPMTPVFLKRLLEKKLKEVEEADEKAKENSTSKLFQSVLKSVLFAKDSVTALASIDIHAKLVWAGISIILPLLLNPKTQQDTMFKGLAYVSELLCRFTVVERMFRDIKLDPECSQASFDLRSQFKDTIVKLYGQILDYSARVFQHLSLSAAKRYARDIVVRDEWADLIEKVQDLETTCKKQIGIISRQSIDVRFGDLQAKMELLQKEWTLGSSVLLQTRDEVKATRMDAVETEMKRQEDRKREKEEEILSSLGGSLNYRDHLARNPDRVPGTCDWLLRNTKFIHWSHSMASDLIWISADPGCGKSVLAKALVVEKALLGEIPRQICYFFFKDDALEQRSVTNALRAILHQIFSHNRKLIRHYRRTEAIGIQTLWDMLVACAEDPEAGEIICVIDALDECAESDRKVFTKELISFYSRQSIWSARSARLKFLITSRGYAEIGRDFRPLTATMSTIRIKGEEELSKISDDVNSVIQARIPELIDELGLDGTDQKVMTEKFLNTTQRTFLWVSLIFEVIRKSWSSFLVEGDLANAIETLPTTVDDAYTAILGKSSNPMLARKLLHIVVAATRPLTSYEMHVALTIKRDTKSLKDLGLKGDFATKIRDICGLFISIIDDKIYLIHQTAKEFLISNTNTLEQVSNEQIWKHALRLGESNLILARSCIWLLLLEDHEECPNDLDSICLDEEEDVYLDAVCFAEEDSDEADMDGSSFDSSYSKRLWKTINAHSPSRSFLEYAAENWPVHFQDSSGVDETLIEDSNHLINGRSSESLTWFILYVGLVARVWPAEYSNYSAIGSWLRREMEYSELIAENVTNQDWPECEVADKHGKILLSAALSYGHLAVVDPLIEKGFAQDPEERLLWIAVHTGNMEMVKLMMYENSDLNLRYEDGETLLTIAARKGFAEIAKLLIEAGSYIETADNHGSTPLMAAAQAGSEHSVECLLKAGADVESVGEQGRTPLMAAAGAGSGSSVKCLIKMGANVDARDEEGRTPLLSATTEDTAKHLIDAGADMDAADIHGRTKLLLDAALDYNLSVFKYLVSRGANLKAVDLRGKTILETAADWGHLDMVKFLMEEDRSITDDERAAAFVMAAAFGKVEVMTFLMGKGVGLEARDKCGNTALLAARRGEYRELVKWLIRKGADVNAANDKGETVQSLGYGSL